MIDVFRPRERLHFEKPRGGNRYMLWIDGVGAYLLCLGERVTIGGPAVDAEPADISLLANLSRRHATFLRHGEGYLLEAHSPTRVAGRVVSDKTYLSDGSELALGESVRLRFRMPTVLSASAKLEFLSGHRPARSVDGVILMAENCLIGPGLENHIRCADWSESIVLFVREGEFYCKSRGRQLVDGTPVAATTALFPGNVVSGGDYSFRLETVE